MRIYIKYMVSLRCKMLVKDELKALGIKHAIVDLGTVDLLDDIKPSQRELLKTALLKSGLELMDDKKAILIEKIKNVITELIHFTDEVPKVNTTHYLSQKLGYDYTYLANIFSEVQGTTIEHYIILHKIERVKELLLYNEMNLSEISYLLNYSSVSHLSNQFKKITGLTPTFFKNLKNKKRNTLDNV